MKIKQCAFIALLLCMLTIAHSQELKKGDTVSDSPICDVLNDEDNELRLSEFKGKTIILDFWSTNCSACLKSFRKLDSMQKIFNDQIQIVLINNSTRDSTVNFFARKKNLYRPNLPMITNDELFTEYFPHQGRPYYVVLDSNRQVKYFPSTLTFSFVENLVNNNHKTLKEKQQRRYLKSAIDSQLHKVIQFSSTLVKASAAVSFTKIKSDELHELVINNRSAADLYSIAYDRTKELEFSRPGRLVIEGVNPYPYERPVNSEAAQQWSENYAYNYHLIVSAQKDLQLNKILQQDLQRFFGFSVSIEKRKIKSLALVRIGEEDKLKSKGGTSSSNFYLQISEYLEKIDSLRSIKNGTWKNFMEQIKYVTEYYQKTPFVDATGFSSDKRIDIGFDGAVLDSRDLGQYRKELRKYNLDLQPRLSETDVLVLKMPVKQKRE